jgi:hypothetical protein
VEEDEGPWVSCFLPLVHIIIAVVLLETNDAIELSNPT